MVAVNSTGIDSLKASMASSSSICGRAQWPDSARDRGIETLVARPAALAVERALGNFERIVKVALRQR